MNWIPYRNSHLFSANITAELFFKPSEVVLTRNDALVFVVDTPDEERFPETARLLRKVIEWEGNSGKPLLVFANKCDREAYKPDELFKILELENIKNRKWHFQKCSAIKNEGIVEGFDWLFSVLSDKKKEIMKEND